MKQKHLKAAACAALAAAALTALPVQARAAEATEVPVTINYAASQAARAPSVLIPKEINLKDETTCDYSVWAYCEKAELPSLFDSVTVEPSDSFTLTNERTGDTFTASVEQDVTEFLADDVKNGEEYDMDGTAVMRKAAEGTISVEGIPEGRWTGAMTFYVNEVAHHHDYIVPLMSGDNLCVEGYACFCGQEASHNHNWTEAVKREEGYGAGLIIEYYKCPDCGELITGEGYGKLVEANKKASETIKNAWIAQNITSDMTDAEKVKAVIREMKTWKYEHLPQASYVMANIERKGVCENGNNTFKNYCAAMGIRAEVVDMEPFGIPDHVCSYVWIDGEQCFVDATPGDQGLMGSQAVIWTMDGFDLYFDWLDGYVSDEEFDMWIGDYEM